MKNYIPGSVCTALECLICLQNHIPRSVILFFALSVIIFHNSSLSADAQGAASPKISISEKEISEELAKIDAEVSGKVFRVVLLPFQEALLSSEISGKVRKINLEVGDSFKEGEELVVFDDKVFAASLEKAKATLAAANLSCESMKDLRSRNDASLVDLANAQREKASAEAEYIFALRNFNACHIKAPFAGRVSGVYIHEFELVESGRPLLKIIDDDLLLGHIILPERLYSQIRDGMTLSLKIAGNPVSGTLCRISPNINPSSAMFEAYIKIDNKQRLLRAGSTGWVAVEEFDGR